MQKLSILDFHKMKQMGNPLAWITAYDFPTGHIAEQAGIDMILVGDSGGMVQLGYKTTNPVTMDEMLVLAKAARRGAPNTFIVGDMPQGSYEISEENAVFNSLRFVKEGGCDAIKCEGGKRVAGKVKAMVDAGVSVIGHLGLTPQSSTSFGGYKVQGKTKESFEALLEDSLALQDAGITALLLEAMPAESAGQIAKQLKVPVYGIGVGNLVDGQLLIMHDLLGFYSIFRPKFAKCYVPEVIEDFLHHLSTTDSQQRAKECKDGLTVIATMALKRYVKEVREKIFPQKECMYNINSDDLENVKSSSYWIAEKS